MNDSRESEAYLDIVWKQYRKNRFAVLSVWVLGFLFLLAILAPVIASNQPFLFRDGDATIFPWFRALFNTEETVDFVFNMAAIALLPWLASAFFLNRRWKRHGRPARARVPRIALLYLAFIAVLIVLCGPLHARPTNAYWARNFPLEQFQSKGASSGVFPLIPLGPAEQDTFSRYKPPLYRKPASELLESNDAFVHLLGTDDSGRDVFVRMLYGTRISLTVGFVAVGLYVTIGIFLGSIAGYFGGRVDMFISRIVEVVLLFPAFFLILTLVALLGPSIYMIMIVIGLTGWPTVARLIRGEVLRQRNMDYVAAARALGASHGRIVFRHILPNALSPALVAAPFGIAGAIITEAGLSLLGFGVRPPAPSWGTLLNLAHGNYSNWWLVVVPSVAIFVTVTVFNLAGNGLRDAMDPRLKT